MINTFGSQKDLKISQKLSHLSWGLVLLITLLAAIGVACLYSAGNGDMGRWANAHIVRFGMGFVAMMIIAMIDVKWIYRLAYIGYIGVFILLVIVEVKGHVGMGAQRWIDLGFMKLQPSEMMKLAVIVALARYFHGLRAEDCRKVLYLIPAFVLIAAPVGLVLLQPDLGTSVMIVAAGMGLIFVAGGPLWLYITGALGAVAAMPIVWNLMHDYQRRRVLTFLDPESDPLGAGYHITQSKIALGSGGIGGKGFMNGSQSNLNFLPEKQTDFIFTLWSEEWGLLGGLFLLFLHGLVCLYCAWIAFRSRNQFGRLIAFGLMLNFSVYMFVNVSMVMGLIPVVGAPLPLISYGGTSMLAVMIGFGMVLSVGIHRDTKLPKNNV